MNTGTHIGTGKAQDHQPSLFWQLWPFSALATVEVKSSLPVKHDGTSPAFQELGISEANMSPVAFSVFGVFCVCSPPQDIVPPSGAWVHQGYWA